jgi:hypothetical protein
MTILPVDHHCHNKISFLVFIFGILWKSQKALHLMHCGIKSPRHACHILSCIQFLYRFDLVMFPDVNSMFKTHRWTYCGPCTLGLDDWQGCHLLFVYVERSLSYPYYTIHACMYSICIRAIRELNWNPEAGLSAIVQPSTNMEWMGLVPYQAPFHDLIVKVSLIKTYWPHMQMQLNDQTDSAKIVSLLTWTYICENMILFITWPDVCCPDYYAHIWNNLIL